MIGGLSVRDLSVAIAGRPVLEGVSLDLAPGEVLGLAGESGSGKSMTALAVMGLLPRGARVSGRVTQDGTNLLTLTDRQMNRLRGARIGMIFQEPMTALNPLMTIGDQVAEVLRLHRRLSRTDARAVARATLDRVGLPAPRFPLEAWPHQLSGGQRQRVAIAVAIALRPDLLIADEPTTALDVTTQAQILDLLGGLVRSEGMGLILITHDLAVLAGRADRVAVMQDGRVVEQGPTQALFRHHAHPYTRALFKAAQHVPRQGGPGPAAAAGNRRDEEADRPPLLEVRDVVRSYPTPGGALRAVDGVSLDLRPGESLGLVGESGCGKSTLTRAILGLDPIQGGSIRLDGHAVDVRRGVPPVVRAGMQVVFQDPFASFDPRWRVARLVAEPFHLTGRPADWRVRVGAALHAVGLEADAGSRFIHQFSGGQRQRIAIARALITRPRLIVLDEAVSALDVRVRAQILDLLADLRATHGLAYLFISHDLGVVRAITDRVLVMQSGRIVESGPTAEVLTRPRDPYARRLLAATPRIPEGWEAA